MYFVEASPPGRALPCSFNHAPLRGEGAVPWIPDIMHKLLLKRAMPNGPFRHLGVAQLSMVALALFSSPASSSPVGPITEMVVAQSGIGPQAENCSAFLVTPAEAQAFFDRAVVISSRQQHDYFLFGPCSASGTFKSRYDTWQWSIRNLGTGSITATNGDTVLLGDPGQESSLADD